jgi:uncharacterized RDD family membrane protein YckC
MPNFCPTCGKPLQFENAEICPSCGVRIQPPKPIGEKYAGFWIRFGAFLIDAVIILIILCVIGFCIALYIAVSNPLTSANYFESTSWGITFWIIGLIISWIYFAYQESSSKQATIGKQAFSLIVTDTEGNRLSFEKSTARWLAKILSALILCIGFIMIGFTERKQGLHDMIVNTYVFYKNQI